MEAEDHVRHRYPVVWLAIAIILSLTLDVSNSVRITVAIQSFYGEIIALKHIIPTLLYMSKFGEIKSHYNVQVKKEKLNID